MKAERIAEIEQVSGKTLVIADPQRVIAEAEAIAFSDITHVLVCASVQQLQELPEAVRRAIKSVKQTSTTRTQEDGTKITNTTLQFTMHDKIEMLKLLALITQAVKDPAKNGDDTPAFTGFSVVLPPKQAQ